MLKTLTVCSLALFLARPAYGQAYCEQVRQAVATYGHKAARQHALANYGREAVAEADKCLRARVAAPSARARHKKRAGRS